MVKFAVLPQNVLLLKPDQGWDSRSANQIPATIEELIGLGSEVLVLLRPRGVPETRIRMRLPERMVRRYSIAPGKEIRVCLRADDIILLQPDKDTCRNQFSPLAPELKFGSAARKPS